MLPISLCLCLGLGFIIESGLLLGESLKSKLVLALWISTMGSSVVGFLAGFLAFGYSLRVELIFAAGTFIFFYLMIFRKKILPAINELSLALFNTIFIFQYFFTIHGELNRQGINDSIFLNLICIFSVIVFINALVEMTTPFFIKLIFYVWYLLMACILLLFTIYQMNFSIENNSFITYLTFISIGCVVFELSIDALAVIYLIPIPMKGQSLSNRLSRIKLHIELLTNKYSEEKTDTLQNLLIILCLISLLLWNARYIQFNTIFILNAVLIINSILTGSIFSKKKAGILNNADDEGLDFFNSFMELSINELNPNAPTELPENLKKGYVLDDKTVSLNLSSALSTDKLYADHTLFVGAIKPYMTASTLITNIYKAKNFGACNRENPGTTPLTLQSSLKIMDQIFSTQIALKCIGKNEFNKTTFCNAKINSVKY
ncbi:MAG: hypothetical protein P4M14_03130 [Gammaproteobacteria bacterium]|nr:hypothetical protein [Gammaproteobacteria bacterium]